MKLTDRQKLDMLKIHALGKDGWTGLKTGWSLSRKGLVKLAVIQLDNWTMWTITEKGIELALELTQ